MRSRLCSFFGFHALALATLLPGLGFLRGCTRLCITALCRLGIATTEIEIQCADSARPISFNHNLIPP